MLHTNPKLAEALNAHKNFGTPQHSYVYVRMFGKHKLMKKNGAAQFLGLFCKVIPAPNFADLRIVLPSSVIIVNLSKNAYYALPDVNERGAITTKHRAENTATTAPDAAAKLLLWYLTHRPGKLNLRALELQ